MSLQVVSSAGAIKESNSFGNAGYGTALPGSPTDGMEYVLTDSTSAPTYRWRFRYNPASASSYKWEYVGGTAKFVRDDTSNNTAVDSTWTDPTNNVTFTTPNAGDWEITFGANGADSIGASGILIGIYLGTTPVTADSLNVISDTHASRTIRPTALAASTVLKMQYQGTGDTKTVRNKWLSVTPVRVS